MCKYSIIIVTYNSENFIGKNLQSIFHQLDPKEWEVVVIDNSSTDMTVDEIKPGFQFVKLILNKQNIGFAAAVNQGFKLVGGEYILILNPDTELENIFLNKLSEFIDIRSNISIAGFKNIDSEGSVRPSTWKLPNLITLFIEMILPYNFSVRFMVDNPDHESKVEAIGGACMLIHRTVFERLNGFDEEFFMYYEDMDFCKRAIEAGYTITFFPELEVTHHLARSSWQDPQGFYINFYVSKMKYFKKHFKKHIFYLSFFILVTGIISRILIYGIVGICSKHLLRLSKYHIFVLEKVIKNYKKSI